MNLTNFETIADNVPSMCIPRTFINITRKHVYKTIDDLNLGVIDHIDMLRRKNEKGEEFQRIFIHFSKWHSNSVADRARSLLLSGKEIKIIYDDPWFWKISMNRLSEHASRRMATPSSYQNGNAVAPHPSSPPRRTYAQMTCNPPPAPRKNNRPNDDERGRVQDIATDRLDYWPRSPSTSPPSYPNSASA
jgi:hypothetical protein